MEVWAEQVNKTAWHPQHYVPKKSLFVATPTYVVHRDCFFVLQPSSFFEVHLPCVKEPVREVEKEESLYIYEFYDPATEKFSYGCKGKIKFEEFEKACSKQYHINKSSFPKVYAVKYIKRRGVTWTHSI